MHRPYRDSTACRPLMAILHALWYVSWSLDTSEEFTWMTSESKAHLEISSPCAISSHMSSGALSWLCLVLGYHTRSPADSRWGGCHSSTAFCCGDRPLVGKIGYALLAFRVGRWSCVLYMAQKLLVFLVMSTLLRFCTAAASSGACRCGTYVPTVCFCTLQVELDERAWLLAAGGAPDPSGDSSSPLGATIALSVEE